ncbi:MAG TPA: right-handed parallel beta-helix repeat-containing protein [Chitinophagaceae bacterium]|nr:right-handed parallel beta-helix repeat-containing protein [Chitinophagaceae bacterium]
MKRILTVFLFVCLFHFCQATTYYFSSTIGNDNYTSTEAQHSTTPWRTLDHLNTIINSLQAGDSILFKSGETFYGSIITASSGIADAPIVFSTYGAGGNATITGLVALSGWVYSGNGIWESYNPQLGSEVNIVLLNGGQIPKGRYPNADETNKGYLTYEGHNSNVSITDYELNADTSWTGAEVVIRNQRSIIDRAPITAHAGNTLFYNTSVDWEANNGFGYFIQNHMKTLDKKGEWYYDASVKKLYVFFGTGGPSGTVHASAVNTLISSRYQSHIVFNRLNLTGSNANSFDIYYAEDIRIKNCNILWSGETAVMAADAKKILFENNSITYSNNMGLDFQYACDNSIITKNKITNIGLFPGMGYRGTTGNPTNSAFTAMAITNSPNTLIEYNDIENIGYSGISFMGNDITIKNNLVKNFTITKDDGGGIYTWNGNTALPDNYGRKVIGNIVVDGIGAVEGTNDFINTGAQGIYMDLNSSGVEISGNTIANCTEAGLYSNSPHEIDYINNTLYNNAIQFAVFQFEGILSRNLKLKKNVFFSKWSNQLNMGLSSNDYDIASFGEFDENYYCRPIAEDFVIKTKQGLTSSYKHKSLQDWKSVYNMDRNSKKTAKQIAPYRIMSKTSANKFSNENFNSDVSGISISSDMGNAQLSWTSGSRLDGGALQVSYSGISSQQNQTGVYVPIGAMDATKKYVLKFSTFSSAEGLFTYRFLQDRAPWYNLVETANFKVTPGRNEHEFLITSAPTDMDMALKIETYTQSPFQIDNLRFYEAEASITNPDDSIRFEYNASTLAKTIELDGMYVDVNDTSYFGKVTLQPYSSIVLIKQPDLIVLPFKFLDVTGYVSNKGVELNWSTGNEGNSRYFEIEKSTGKRGFVSIGRVQANKLKEGSKYTFVDPAPDFGSNDYRIKQVDEKDKASFSRIVNIRNGNDLNVTVGPVPAGNFINIIMNRNVDDKDASITVISSAGNVVKSIASPAKGSVIPVNVSGLTPGTYFLSFKSESGSFYKQFIKQ